MKLCDKLITIMVFSLAILFLYSGTKYIFNTSPDILLAVLHYIASLALFLASLVNVHRLYSEKDNN